MAAPRSWADQLMEDLRRGSGTGVDPTLIAAQLRLTPTELLQRLQEACDAAEALHHARRLPNPARGA